jgi:hypothetical protein
MSAGEDQPMDLIAIAIAVVFFGAMVLLVEGLDRV